MKESWSHISKALSEYLSNSVLYCSSRPSCLPIVHRSQTQQSPGAECELHLDTTSTRNVWRECPLIFREKQQNLIPQWSPCRSALWNFHSIIYTQVGHCDCQLSTILMLTNVKELSVSFILFCINWVSCYIWKIQQNSYLRNQCTAKGLRNVNEGSVLVTSIVDWAESYSGLTSHQSRTFPSINEVTLWVPWCMRLMLECETLSMAVLVPSPLYNSKLRTCRHNWLWPMLRLCVCECTMRHQAVQLQRICSSLCSQGHPPRYSHHHLNYTIITNLQYPPWITWSLERLSGHKGATWFQVSSSFFWDVWDTSCLLFFKAFFPLYRDHFITLR